MNDHFGYWFAGFVDGEGSFSVGFDKKNMFRVSFSITQRADQLHMLEYVQSELKFGSIFEKGIRGSFIGSKPQIRFDIKNKRECLRLVHILEQFPLKSNKAKTFELWARAVREYQRPRKYQDTHYLRELWKGIKASTKFQQVDSPHLSKRIDSQLKMEGLTNNKY